MLPPFDPFTYCPCCTREWDYVKNICNGCGFHPKANKLDAAMMDNAINLFLAMRKARND